MSKYDEAITILVERFARDRDISIATLEDGRPYVRMVDAYYENGAFYTVTSALSNKIKHIEENSEVAVCGEWFSGHGIGENLGHVLDEKNAPIMATLREAFAHWYIAHVDESDPNRCLLRVKLTDGILIHEGATFAIDFINQTA